MLHSIKSSEVSKSTQASITQDKFHSVGTQKKGAFTACRALSVGAPHPVSNQTPPPVIVPRKHTNQHQPAKKVTVVTAPLFQYERLNDLQDVVALTPLNKV